jgi:capsular polysaccharide biosynthesis protein
VSNSTESHRPTEHEPAEQDHTEPVDLLGYLRRMGHYWIAGLVAAVIVAGALLGYGATRPADTVGTVWAKAHVMVTMPEPKNEADATVQAEAAPRLINSYVALDGSDKILASTAKILGDGTTVTILRNNTNLYWAGGGQIIAVYALGSDDDQAEKRADALAQAFVKDAPAMLPPVVAGGDDPTLTVVQKAQPSVASPSPTAPSSGGLSRMISSPLVSVLGGVVVGLVVMAIAEIIGNHRRRRD